MKIAVYHRKEYGGTGLYRLHLPHELLAEWGHSITFTDSLKAEDYDCDIFIASKSWFVMANQLVANLKKKGVVTIIDYDDYWLLPPSHLLYPSYVKNKTSQVLIDGLRLYDHVMCTTQLIHDEIRLINSNVEVFENAIDPNNSQFNVVPKESDNVRLGYIGGHCHLPDLQLLEGAPQKLSGKFTVNLFGFDNTEPFNQFADILSGNKALTPNHFNLYKQASARTYTQFYNHIDVALAPLVGDKFNSMKSELKIVEAGFFKKGLIVSKVLPYSPLLTDKNCLSCDSRGQWARRMQRLINNPEQIKDMGEELYLTVKDKFDLHSVTKRREQWYKTLL